MLPNIWGSVFDIARVCFYSGFLVASDYSMPSVSYPASVTALVRVLSSTDFSKATATVIDVFIPKPGFEDLSSLDAAVFVADPHNGLGKDIIVHRF